MSLRFELMKPQVGRVERLTEASHAALVLLSYFLHFDFWIPSSQS